MIIAVLGVDSDVVWARNLHPKMHCCIEKQETMSAAYEQGVSYVPSIPMKSTSDAASGCMTNVDVHRRIGSKILQEESF